MKRLVILAVAITSTLHAFADFSFKANTTVSVDIPAGSNPVIRTALDIFQKDYVAVFGGEVKNDVKGTIHIRIIGQQASFDNQFNSQSLAKLRENSDGFLMEVINDQLYILGSDNRGAAYGLLELSRLIGVSPWEWWADASIEKKKSFSLKNGYRSLQYPSVKYRGIFINDEDWGMNPWSSQTFEPSTVKGQIGPKTHARIFELLLRLRANTFWPAMHSCSVAFFQTPGNREIAEQYGISIGTSHCEPMLRNANTEWKKDGKGAYDFVNNKEEVLKFWESRVKETAGTENIYTLGIRGVHDGKMEGANTLQEQYAALQNVLKSQREMLSTRVNTDLKKIPQAFIPYKEVLDVYDMGLQVPDDVTLMWCDDNYGYIKHFPNEKERARSGGNGVYYHVSYWGRPHDYLWLASTHPAQVYTQMKLAYDKGAKDMWILNVGDIKPAEYLTELFMDMAWNMSAIESNEKGLNAHLSSWLAREFGTSRSKELLAVMNEYYRLAYIHKPEFMAGTRTEEKDPEYKVIKGLASWTEKEILQRIDEYKAMSDKVAKLSAKIPAEKKDAWFELIEYPVLAAAEMNKKQLYGQLARHRRAGWVQSDEAYDSIIQLTARYNSLADGKWNRMMDDAPRKLEVFAKLPHDIATFSIVTEPAEMQIINGTDYKKSEGQKPVVHGLGYQRGAISLALASSVSYSFNAEKKDSIKIDVALVPNHPVAGKQIRFSIQVDDGKPMTFNYATEGRSEEWKENVLNNRTTRTNTYKLAKVDTHTVRITALDEGVILDQLIIR